MLLSRPMDENLRALPVRSLTRKQKVTKHTPVVVYGLTWLKSHPSSPTAFRPNLTLWWKTSAFSTRSSCFGKKKNPCNLRQHKKLRPSQRLVVALQQPVLFTSNLTWTWTQRATQLDITQRVLTQLTHLETCTGTVWGRYLALALAFEFYYLSERCRYTSGTGFRHFPSP